MAAWQSGVAAGRSREALFERPLLKRRVGSSPKPRASREPHRQRTHSGSTKCAIINQPLVGDEPMGVAALHFATRARHAGIISAELASFGRLKLLLAGSRCDGPPLASPRGMRWRVLSYSGTFGRHRRCCVRNPPSSARARAKRYEVAAVFPPRSLRMM